MEFDKRKLNTIERGKNKASYDKKIIYSILDASEICHIAFVFDDTAFVQPINFGRIGDQLYIHGSHLNRMTSALIESKTVCLNVTILDALKLTRSAFHHSVNYRSAMVFGSVEEVLEPQKKIKALKGIINHFVPNRWAHCRPPSDAELKATRVLEISIDFASSKIANTPPKDNKDDLKLDFWAGTITVKKTLMPPIADQFMAHNTEVPKHILEFIENYT